MKILLLTAIAIIAAIPFGWLLGTLYGMQQFGLLLLVFIAGLTLYVHFMSWVNNGLQTAADRFNLGSGLQQHELSGVGARSEALTFEDRRRIRGLPKFIPGSDTPATKVVETAALPKSTAPKPYFKVELRKRLMTGATTTVETHHHVAYQTFGAHTIVQIKAFVEKDPTTNLVRITPCFDLRMWNLEQRQSRETNTATITTHFPRHLLKNIDGLIY